MVSVIASGESIGGSAGLDFYCDFGKLRCTVVVNDNAAFFVDGVISAFLFAHLIVLSDFGMK